MATMTKKTIVTYESDMTLFNSQWTTIFDDKITEMYISGKTDGFATMDVGNTVIKRLWADQSAAEEWIAFVTTTNLSHNIPFSFQIVDI